MDTKRFLFFVFFLGLAVRFLFLGVGFFKDGGDFILNYGDGLGYSLLARNLLEGNGFSQSEGSPYLPDGMRTPLYPIFLAASYAVSGGFWPAVFIQILVGAAISVLCFVCLQKLGFSGKVSRVSATVMAVEPFWAAQSVFLLTETLFIFLVLWAFYLVILDREKEGPAARMTVPALLLGTAALVRPIGLYLIPIFALLFLWRSRKGFTGRFAGVMIFFVIGIGITLPWMFRNYEVFGRATLSSIDVLNLYANYAGGTLAMQNGYSIDRARIVLHNELQGAGVSGSSEESVSFRQKKALEIIGRYPAAFLKLNALTAWQFFTHDSYYDLALRLGFYKESGRPVVTILDLKRSLAVIPGLLVEDPFFFVFILGRLLWIAVFFIFLWGLYLSLRDTANRGRDLAVLAFAGYFFVASLTTGYAINARLRLPVFPFYSAYAVFGAMLLYSKIFPGGTGTRLKEKI